MKKYYSPTKEFATKKPLQITYKIIRFFAKIGYKEPELIFTDESFNPSDNIMICPNHTKIFAPKYFLIQKKYNVRLWVNCYFVNFKACYKHLRNRVVYNLKPKYLLRFLAFCATPLITSFFKSILPIPAYHKDEKVESITMKKSVETFKEGLIQVVFAERTEPKVNDYLYQINYGFTKSALNLYNETGKKVKFFPVYCCQDLNKVLVGKPYEYDPNIEYDEQKLIISSYIQNEIEKLAKSLPEHKIVLYVD